MTPDERSDERWLVLVFAGFLTILVDDRRRAVHDMLAGTVVVPAPPEPSG